MKTAPLFAVVLLSACVSAPKPAPSAATTETTGAPIAQSEGEKETKSALDAWAESKVKSEEASLPRPKTEAMDPLAMNDDTEASFIPKIEKTPGKQLRAKSRGDLAAGVAIVNRSASVDEAAQKLTARLGKPTWIENGTKRVWIAKEGATCHRLVLDADGSVEMDSAKVDEERQLTATARQNACTGEIHRGVSK